MLQKTFLFGFKHRKTLIRCSSQVSEHVLSKDLNAVNANPEESIEYSSSQISKSVLEPLDEDISHVSTYLRPTFNFAAYINKSDTLQQLLKLGVDFHKIEKNSDAAQFILGLKFEDIKEHIIFLSNLGLTTEQIGAIISRNPLLLKEDLENLEVRINYLKYKKFTDEVILHIIQSNPFWLSKSTQEVDESLGFLQNNFQLTGDEVRLVVTKGPRLITNSVDKIKANLFVLKEEMGFNKEELKKIILAKPLIFTNGEDRILKAFEYVHRDMNIPLERIAVEPEVLTTRQKRIMERHSFLTKLGRAQYDPKKPNYISLKSLVTGSDSHFCVELAKSSVQAFNEFLKTL